MGHLAAHLNLLNKAAQRPQYAALLKKLNLRSKYWWRQIVFQNSARNFSFLRRELKFNLTRSASLDFTEIRSRLPTVIGFLEFATIE
jgi:hypothetical protein